MGAAGKVERESATAGSHQQAGELAVAFPVGGSGPSHGTESFGVAQPVLPPRDAPGTENGEGSDGSPTGDSLVLDVASGTRLPAGEKFGSHAGQPETGDGV